MSRFIREIREVWRPLDPADDCSLPDTEVREAELRRIIGAPLDGALPVDLPPRVGRLRRTVFAAAGAVAAGGVLVVANPAQGPAFALTPAPLTTTQTSGAPAADMLRTIIDRTATLAPETRGDIDWMRMQTWALSYANQREFTDAVVPEDRTIERHGDGSAKVTATTGDPIKMYGGVRERLATWWKVKTQDPRHQTYGPGGFPSQWPPTERPPTEPTALKSWLMFGNEPREDVEVLRAVDDLASERVLIRDERTAVLKVLTGLKTLRYEGRAVDRAGREGEAFALESSLTGLPMRYTFVFNALTGTLLTTEQVLISDAGGRDVQIPAVFQYKTFALAA
ncbi:hypothetical protein GCM10010124_14260 [Pilimelia terevasa]|uniref:Uncharacterized protein n=1 Tax=Pilimelia terevasa TaxID=53372 RepID=A0A8J3BRM9_9ACTN|nr:hypothetical protein [Pilimelia terevasa]GGK22854.1 hypothetical protein GCM10010124_14260 [Pilimelia terevasa]